MKDLFDVGLEIDCQLNWIWIQDLEVKGSVLPHLSLSHGVPL